MLIKNTPPPNYEEIQKHFPAANFEKGVLFTYGDTCYCKRITDDLIAHEQTHVDQQLYRGLTPDEWWSKYFVDPAFRYAEELEAYRNQWRYIDTHEKDRNKKYRELDEIATYLSGPLYNNLKSKNEVMIDLKNKSSNIIPTLSNG